MECLPDDCLVEIFKSLTLQNQIKAFKVCQRFHYPLRLVWQDKFELKQFSFELLKNMPHEDFAILMQNIYETIQAIYFRYDDSSRNFEVLKSYEYTQVSEAFIDSLEDMTEDIMQTLVKMIPNVERLTLSGLGPAPKIVLSPLMPLTNLKSLFLNNCEIGHCQLFRLLENTQLRAIEIGRIRCCRNLIQLEKDVVSLERICMKSMDLGLFETEASIRRLVNLKEFVIKAYYSSPKLVWQICALLTKFSPRTEIEVQAMRDASVCRFPKLSQTNIKRLIFGYIETSDIAGRILRCIISLKSLREVFFGACTIDDDDVVNFMRECELDKLELVTCEFNDSVLHIDVPYVTEKRSKPLTLRFVGEMELKGESELLILISN